ncbi:RNA-splicing factor [Spiromyces aspiralis]|uniref:RNA-splicing factor n=1 Tax=Spiromyces aspiralis TaxID=68401 RepID=A0ACC1HQY1_9FUNG|nr:RNA-splicing factor [Spiromyces aspiralis]
MGGGDLNLKKSWHPLTWRNQERIWKERQKAAAEQKKIEQMRKELEEQRQLEEMQRLQEASGASKKKQERLDWMYSTPAAAGGDQRTSDELEAYLLGKKKIDTLLNEKRPAQDQVLSGKMDVFAMSNSKANTYRDTQTKIHLDPMLQIKKQEQAAIEAVLKNPLKLKKLDKAKRHKDGSDSKSRQKHGKDERRKKGRESSNGGSPSDDDDGGHRGRESMRSRRRIDLHDRRAQSQEHRNHIHRRRSRSRDGRVNGHHRSPSGDRYRDERRYRDSHPGRYSDNSNRYHRHRSRSPHYRREDRMPRDDRSDNEERRQQRLREMMNNAQQVDEERSNRVAGIREKEAEEEERERRERLEHSKRGTSSTYLKEVDRQLYDGTNISLVDRLHRNRAYLSKDSNELD